MAYTLVILKIMHSFLGNLVLLCNFFSILCPGYFSIHCILFRLQFIELLLSRWILPLKSTVHHTNVEQYSVIGA